MKQTYYKPTIQVVNVQMKPLLAGSETLPVNTDPVSGNSSDAKGGWSWSDEPEDEYYDE